MSPLNRGLLVAAIGAVTLQLTFSNAYLHFLRPSMRPYLLAAGVTFVVLGVAVAATAWRHRHDASDDGPDDAALVHEHTHHDGVAWLLLLPVALGVLAPAALDAYGTSRATPFQQRQWPLEDFDVQQYLRTQTIAGGVPELPISDYLGAVLRRSNRKFLADHDVRVLGFVTAPAAGAPGHFVLTRYRISCCAADAVPMQIRVAIPAGMHIPPENHWVETTLRLAPTSRRAALLRADATGLKPVSAPTRPYDYQ